MLRHGCLSSCCEEERSRYRYFWGITETRDAIHKGRSALNACCRVVCPVLQHCLKLRNDARRDSRPYGKVL
jgi:hypothetical protein